MKNYFCEFLGTFILVLLGCGSAAIAGEALGTVGIAFAFGLSIVAIAYSVGRVSGGHVNPAVSLAMFALYKFKVITVTEKFRATILTAVTAIFILYMANLILGLFGNHVISNLLWSNTPLAIGISAVICVVAALCLLLDFDRIERFSQYQAPKYMEWYCAMGLMVTIVWLYVEILRLLSILNRR